MKKKLIYFILVILVFLSNDTVLFGTSENPVLLLLAQIVYVGITLYLILNSNSEKSTSWPLMLLLFLIVLSAVTNHDFTFGYLIQINALLTGYIISKNLSFKVFANVFGKVVYYITLLSIVFFALFILFPSLVNIFPVHHNIGEVPYVNLYFYVHFVDLYRNTGIFREPGVFMIYLNLAIMIELFVKQRIDKKTLVVLVIGIITTLSTAGFIILTVIGLLYFFQGKDSKVKFQGMVFVALIALVIFYNFGVFEGTFSKFNTTSGNIDSSIARTASIQVPFAIFLDYPFFGTGLSRFGELYETYSRDLLGIALKADGHSTNTFFNALATYGFYYFIILIILFTKVTKLFSKKILFRIIIFLIFAMMLSNEDIRYSLLFTTLLFYGLVNNHKFLTSE